MWFRAENTAVTKAKSWLLWVLHLNASPQTSVGSRSAEGRRMTGVPLRLDGQGRPLRKSHLSEGVSHFDNEEGWT